MWLKKLRSKKRQMLLLGLVLFSTAGVVNLCISFMAELSSFSKTGINENNTPSAYILTIGTSNFEDHFSDEVPLQEIANVRGLVGKTISVPLKHEGNDISLNYDMGLYGGDYQEWMYMSLSAGDTGAQEPQKGEVWLSETIMAARDIRIGDVITIEYIKPIELTVTAAYRTTCYPKAIGYSPIMMSSQDLLLLEHEEDAALFAVNLNEYSNLAVKNLFKNSQYCIVDRSLDDVRMSLIEYSSAFGSIGTMAGVVIFFVTLLIISFIINSSLIREYRTIGIYKSLGFSDRQIKGVYLKGYLFVGAIGIVVGALASLLLVEKIGGIFTKYVDGFSLSTTSGVCTLITILALTVLQYFSLSRALNKIKKMTPVEAIAIGTNSSEKKLPQSLIKSAKTPFEMAVNEIFKYKKASALMLLVVIASTYLSMLFIMIFYSSAKMIENSNLWFCLPQSDFYVSGAISDDLVQYLEADDRIQSVVTGDFSYKKEMLVEGYEDTVNYIRFDAYSTLDRDATGIRMKEGEPPVKRDEVAVGTGLLGTTGLKTGGNIRLNINGVSKDYRICGAYETVADGGNKVMITTAALTECVPEYVSSRAYITVGDMKAYKDIKAELEGRFPGVLVDTDWLALESSVESIRIMLESLSLLLVCVFIVFSLLNVTIVVLMNNRQWRKKHGIMIAQGFTPQYVIRQGMIKYCILSIVGTLIALAVHLSISGKAAAQLLVDAFVNSNLLLAGFIAGFIALVMVATYLANLTVIRISPIELMEE